MSKNGPSTSSHKSRYVALGAVSALGLLALGGQSVSANSVVVKPGDTVWGIANQYSTTKSALEEANPNSIKKISNSIDLISAGQSLVLPNTTNALASATQTDTTHYVVKSGDTLSAIAKKFGVSVSQLMAWNHLTNADQLKVGQVLIVDGSAATTTTNSAAATTTANNQAAVSQPQTTTTTVAQPTQTVATPVATNNVQSTASAASQAATTQPAAQTTQSTANDQSEVTANTEAVYAAYYQVPTQSQTAQTNTITNAVTTSQQDTANTVTAGQQTASQVAQPTNTASQVVVNNGQGQTVNQGTSQTSQSQGVVNTADQTTAPTPASQAPAGQQTATTTNTSSSANQTTTGQSTGTTTTNNQTTPSTSNTSGGVNFVDDNSQTTTTSTQNDSGSVVSLAVKLANSNIPYVWGGASLSGMDCSGLVDYVYAHATGKQLPHNTVALESYVTTKPVSEAQAGDLLFWGNHGATYHTAIYIGNNQYVAAPQPGQNVQVQTISQYFMPSFAGTVK